jgi:ABC-2 type transport system ATP-binding protein
MAGDPELLFLDEPTTGFDPGARRNAWEIVKNLSSIGKTVFLTTHYMDEAQNLANRVAVIAHGTIVAVGPPGSLAGRDRMMTRIRFRLPPGVPEPERAPHRLPDGSYEIRADQEETTKLVHDLTAWALESGIVLDALEVTPPTLEDVYLELTASEDVTA